MKKLYIHPEINVVSISQNIHLLAGSEVSIGTSGSANNAESREGKWIDEE